MKRFPVLASLALGLVALSGCDDDYRGASIGMNPSPYAGWYDGHYGPIFDGYWGFDNLFYYRTGPNDRAFRRGDPRHFRPGDGPSPGPGFGRFQGTLRPPPQGTRMPHFHPPGNPRGH